MSLNEDRIKYVWTPIIIMGVILIAVSPAILLNSVPRDEQGNLVPILSNEQTITPSATPSAAPVSEENLTPVAGVILEKHADELTGKYYLVIDDKVSGTEQTREVTKSVYSTVVVGLMFTITS